MNKEERTNKNRIDLLEVQKDIRMIAGHLFRCRPEEITLELTTGEISGDPYIFCEILHKGKPLDTERYFPIGPYSGFGETVEKAIVDLLFMIRVRAEETSRMLLEILEERQYPTNADLTALWTKKGETP